MGVITTTTLPGTRQRAVRGHGCSGFRTLHGCYGSDRITGGTHPATRAPGIVSRLPVGSSAKVTFGLFTRARAMTTRCFVRLRG